MAGWSLQPLLVLSRTLVTRLFPTTWQMLGVNYYLLDFHTFICNVVEVFLDLTVRKTFNEQKVNEKVTTENKSYLSLF